MYKLRIDTGSSLNAGILKYLGREEKSSNPIIADAGSVRDAYMWQGSHPDIVQRVWDELGKKLPASCRCLVYGTPAIVHDRTGIVIAACNGTQYNIRLTAADFKEAINKGSKTRIRWSNGQEMDSSQILGADWVFGGWLNEETEWCLNTYNLYKFLST